MATIAYLCKSLLCIGHVLISRIEHGLVTGIIREGSSPGGEHKRVLLVVLLVSQCIVHCKTSSHSLNMIVHPAYLDDVETQLHNVF